MLKYIKILNCDIANGPGFRVSLFVSGCSLHCPGCFNPDSWDFNCGQPFSIKVQNKIMELLKPDYIKGLSILGGNPTEPQNEPELALFLKRVKEFYPDKDIWMWSGHTYEELLARNDELIKYCDVLIEGPFIESLKDFTIPWRGSTNQRIINLKS